MPLVGNIRDFSLSDFLYLVDRGYKTGCLHLDRNNDAASLYFEKGKLITALRQHDRTNVADLLVSKGKLTSQQAETALDAFRNDSGAPVAQILVRLDLMPRDDLQKVLQQHVEESVYSLFGWPEGEFRFEQNQKPEMSAPIMPTPLGVEHLIIEGVRRIDEWGRIKDRIPSTDIVVKFIDQGSEKSRGVKLAPEEWRVFARINGRDTLAEIGKKTNMGDFDICRIVYGFLTAGLVDVVRSQIPTGMMSTGRPMSDAPTVKKSLVSRIMNRIRAM